jgi:uncharacterized membrane protein SirB2
MFEVVRWGHVICVTMSGLFFLYRGYLLFGRGYSLQQPWLRHTADAIDTLLLVSGMTLAWLLSLAPWDHPWLAAKLSALCLYILLGFAAFRLLNGKGWRMAAWCAAMLTFAYMIAVAVTRNPWPPSG